AHLLRQARPAREGGARALARGDGRPLRGARRLTSGAGIASDALPSAREVVMGIRIVRSGRPRACGEGLRGGTVGPPPRGEQKRALATRDHSGVRLAALAPSAAHVHSAHAAESERHWTRVAKRYRREMAAPAASRLLDLLAAFSQASDFAVGCYCPDEAHCHRSTLRELLAERGARLA